MKQVGLSIKCLALLTILTICCVMTAVAEEAAQHIDSTSKLPDSKNQIIRLLNSGPVPSALHMKLSDSIVFFLNSTDSSLVTLQVDFGQNRTHCASSNLRIEQAGVVRSIRPFGPNDFSSMCFHDRGKYPFRIFGLPAQPNGVAGEIVVE